MSLCNYDGECKLSFLDMDRAYGTWCKWVAIFINGLKSVATTCSEPMALVNIRL
jgi:hypothetical protein